MVLGVLLLALPLRAEIYRCEDAGGGVRFTSDPAECEHPVEHTPRGAAEALEPAAPSRDASAPPGDRHAGEAPEPDLGALFAPVDPAAWEVIDAPPEPENDAELRAAGLRVSRARHYTRALGPVSEVCTVEIWAFARPAQAAAADAGFERKGWQHYVAGSLLVLAHGVRLERKVGSREGLVPGCVHLAEATRDRAARAAGERGAAAPPAGRAGPPDRPGERGPG